MAIENDTPQSVDEATTAYLERIAERMSSRRGLLVKIGKFALRISGLTLIPLLPVDRRVAAQSSCGDDLLCGQYGRICAGCCGHTVGVNACPGCLNQGNSSWFGCCYINSTCEWRMMQYYDCCDPDGTHADCEGDFCYRNPETQPAWCSGAGQYRCTIAINYGVC